MHLDVCLICCNDCVMLGLDWAEPMMYLVCMSHVHAFSCIHIINSLYLSILCCWYFSECLSPSLSFLCQSAIWHPNANPFCPRTLFISENQVLLPRTPLYLTFSFVMRRPVRTSQRTFVDEAFIQNAKSSYQIFLILTYPLSSTVRVGSHYVASQSHALP